MKVMEVVAQFMPEIDASMRERYSGRYKKAMSSILQMLGFIGAQRRRSYLKGKSEWIYTLPADTLEHKRWGLSKEEFIQDFYDRYLDWCERFNERPLLAMPEGPPLSEVLV